MKDGKKPEHTRTVRVIGIGDAGCNILSHMAAAMPDGPEMTAINTDARSRTENVRFLQIGEPMTHGAGAGGNPQIARRAAEHDVRAIRDLLQHTDILFLVAGLGGGTGTGATHFLLQEARKAGILSLCMAILPFEFEGKRRCDQAERGLAVVRELADAAVQLPNQRLFETIGSEARMEDAFTIANQTIVNGLCALWKTITRRGMINLDFADIRSLMEYAKAGCVLGCLEGTGPDKIKTIVEAAQTEPLLLRGKALEKAAALLLIVQGGNDVTLGDMDRVARELGALSNPNAFLLTGLTCEPSFDNRLRVTILACEGRLSTREERKPDKPAAPAARPERSPKVLQAGLFDETLSDQGRFKNLEPTFYAGNNLDIPTFIRRGILIQKAKNEEH